MGWPMWYLYFLMKNNNKTQNIKINITDSVARAAKARLPIVVDALDGNARLRCNRWPGMTSLYDSHRMLSLIEDLAFGYSISTNRIVTLQSEVTTFSAVLGPQLFSAVGTMIAQA